MYLKKLITLAVFGLLLGSSVFAQSDCVDTPPSDLNEEQITGIMAELTWELVSGATSYEVWISSLPGQLQTTMGSGIGVSDLTPETEYDWAVRAVCPAGKTAWSFSSFTTASVPCLSMPPSGLNNDNISFFSADLSWDAVPGATGYQVWESNTSGITLVDEATTSLALSGLNADTEYDWAVRAVCSGGGTTEWSFGNFTTLGEVCLNSSPENLAETNIISVSANLNWDAVPDAVSYQVWSSSTPGVLQDAGANTSYFLQGLLPNTEYNWAVRAVCPGGGVSQWSFGNFMTTSNICLSAEVPNLTEENITQTSADLSWGSVPGAVSFEVWTSLDGSVQNVGFATSFLLSNLGPGLEYDWAVRAVCPSGGKSDWSFGNFKTLGIPCTETPPSNLQVTNISTATADLNWDPVVGASGYHIWNSNELGTYAVVGAGTTTFNLSGLSASTEYDWAVRAVCINGGISDWTFDSFTTSSNFGAGTNALQSNNDGFNEQSADTRSNVATAVLPAQVKVFPNPVTSNYVNVQLDNAQVMERISLYSLTGELIQWVDGLADRQYELNFNTTLTAGTYILRIEGADFAVAKRIVVQ
jgi:hypothetical protein